MGSNMNFVEQVTALTLLVDFFLGVTFGVVGRAVHGSGRRERSLLIFGGDRVPGGGNQWRCDDFGGHRKERTR